MEELTLKKIVNSGERGGPLVKLHVLKDKGMQALKWEELAWVRHRST